MLTCAGLCCCVVVAHRLESEMRTNAKNIAAAEHTVLMNDKSLAELERKLSEAEHENAGLTKHSTDQQQVRRSNMCSQVQPRSTTAGVRRLFIALLQDRPNACCTLIGLASRSWQSWWSRPRTS
jgi:hypothetical protein